MKIRIVTCASLFDGHDVSINILRRILQSLGAEIIHLGHNRSVKEVVQAVLQEDAHAVAVSSYQGGHMEYFKFLRQSLNECSLDHVKIFGGGGGVITPSEIEILHHCGIEKIYSPTDGQKLGLMGIGEDVLKRCANIQFPKYEKYNTMNSVELARAISAIENDQTPNQFQVQNIKNNQRKKNIPVLGITGTGGAGKSSLIDELLVRFYRVDPNFKIILLSVDPTRKNTGGALLGDRIRMGQLSRGPYFLRSLATRDSENELNKHMAEILNCIQTSDFQLIIIETSGIGQACDAITKISDYHLYVMTPEYGAPSQLEKIEMLHSSHFVAINKYERSHGDDALRDVRKQYQRNKELFSTPIENLPIFGTCANEINNKGINDLFSCIVSTLSLQIKIEQLVNSDNPITIIPSERIHYLSEISSCIKKYHQNVDKKSSLIRDFYAMERTQELLPKLKSEIQNQKDELSKKIGERAFQEIAECEQESKNRQAKNYEYKIGKKSVSVQTTFDSLSMESIPRVVCFKDTQNKSEIYNFYHKENYPGLFPYTNGVFPYKKLDEEVKRQFAGVGGPKRTNERFHYLTKDDNGHARLSVAFDSVTLYGEDPHERLDIFGKIGEAGVSIATLDDMVDLFQGFDLLSEKTSVSMTINGPAPIVLAMYMNAAMKQGLSESDYYKPEKRIEIMQSVRGTVQSDILKEDQAQNTCIFSLPFALKMMADVQEYFCQNDIRRYYSVSISGYHIAEAGANPITQLAFTLANGFTYLEYYLSRGLDINKVCSNLSFFFSNGLDVEYTVLGRVARRIWSIALANIPHYNASKDAQKLKYHIQTSGRSLHAQEMTFNDIRTTLQAFLAISDSCNSLHTNAFDEAITTPTKESVRQAMAIQKIILQEFGFNKIENPLQGSFMITELTNRVENAVLEEFERINKRGGVLGAMEYMYQRSKIQDESYLYESQKDSGKLPIIGVNTFLAAQTTNSHSDDTKLDQELSRCSDFEKNNQIQRLREFQKRNASVSAEYKKRLVDVVTSGKNVFEELLISVNYLSLGEITSVLFDVGGQYRRNI